MWIFSGTDRRNASMVIAANSSVPIGAPARVPISSGAIVVIQVNSGQQRGNASFSYKVVGTKYNWYERPFVGKKIVYFYLFLAQIRNIRSNLISFFITSIIFHCFNFFNQQIDDILIILQYWKSFQIFCVKSTIPELLNLQRNLCSVYLQKL